MLERLLYMDVDVYICGVHFDISENNSSSKTLYINIACSVFHYNLQACHVITYNQEMEGVNLRRGCFLCLS